MFSFFIALVDFLKVCTNRSAKPVVPKVGVLTPSGVAGAVAGGREMIFRNNVFACLLTRGPSPSH